MGERPLEAGKLVVKNINLFCFYCSLHIGYGHWWWKTTELDALFILMTHSTPSVDQLGQSQVVTSLLLAKVLKRTLKQNENLRLCIQSRFVAQLLKKRWLGFLSMTIQKKQHPIFCSNLFFLQVPSCAKCYLLQNLTRLKAMTLKGENANIQKCISPLTSLPF